MRILWTKPAGIDLDNIETYISPDNPRAAAKTVLRIIECVENSLPTHPNMGRAGRIFGTRELVIPDTPYIVMYTVKNEQVSIIRVLHGAQKWPKRI